MLRRLTAASLALSSLLLIAPARADAPPFTVMQGFELMHLHDASFDNVPVVGVPIGSWDFAWDLGPTIRAETGNADLIMFRWPTVTSVQNGTELVNLDIEALQLMTEAPVDLGAGLGTYFFTLQTMRGPADTTNWQGSPLPLPAISTGSRQLTFLQDLAPGVSGHGVFTTELRFACDLRIGALNGPILRDAYVTVSNEQNTPPWSHYPMQDSLWLEGINARLDGTSQAGDWFPLPTYIVRSSPGEAYSRFFVSAATELPPAGTVDDPILPNVGVPGGGFGFTMPIGTNGLGLTTPIFVDPVVAIGYEYEVLSGPLFASVLIPAALPGGDAEFILTAGDSSYPLLAGTAFDLLALDPAGFSAFTITGIDPAEGLNPANPLAFVTGLTFTSAGNVNMTMIPIVPEPASATILLAAVGVALLRRARRC